MIDSELIKTYYVVFDYRRYEGWRWWHYFVDKKWNHCFILTEDKNGWTSKFEVVAGGFDYQCHCISLKECLQGYIDEGVTAIVSYTASSVGKHRPRQRGIISCVSIAKAFLWIDSYLTFTPFQLYKLILASDGNLIYELGVQKMGSKRPKKSRAEKEAEQRLAERERELELREKAEKEKLDSKLKSRRGRTGGRRSLISGLETGTLDDIGDTLG